MARALIARSLGALCVSACSRVPAPLASVDDVPARAAATAPSAFGLGGTASPTATATATANPSAAPVATAVERDAWLRAKGAKKDFSGTSPEASCEEMRVGSPAEDVIVCGGIEHVQKGIELYRVLSRRQVFAVRSGRVTPLFDVIDSVMPLDKIDEDGSNIVDLVVTFAPDGLSIAVADSTSAGCDAAKRSFDEQEKYGRTPWIDFDRPLVARACQGRGRYEWRSGRFVKAGSR